MDPYIASQRRRRNIAMAVFLGSSLFFGIADLFLYRSETWMSGSWVLDTIIGVTAIAAWCRHDSHVRGCLLSSRLLILILLLPVLGVPKYLVQSRGWRGAAKVGFGLPVFVLNLALYHAGWYGSYWIASVSGYFGS